VYSTLLFFPYYSNLLLRRRRWTRIFRWGVLGYVLPQLPFLWSYRVFCCSVSLRVIIVFRDITYVIIILYSWHMVICEHFWPYVWNNWSWVMHTMSTWLWHKKLGMTLQGCIWFESPWRSRLWVMAWSMCRNVVIKLHWWFICTLRLMLMIRITYIKCWLITLACLV
jgi:hypothetical protein